MEPQPIIRLAHTPAAWRNALATSPEWTVHTVITSPAGIVWPDWLEHFGTGRVRFTESLLVLIEPGITFKTVRLAEIASMEFSGPFMPFFPPLCRVILKQP